MVSKKRPAGEPAVESKKSKTPRSRVLTVASLVDEPSLVDLEEGDQTAVQTHQPDAALAKSGKVPLTGARAVASGQGSGSKRMIDPSASEGSLGPMRVKSYRQSSASSQEETPGSQIGSLYLQYLQNAGDREPEKPRVTAALDLREITSCWMKAVPIEQREKLPGYGGLDGLNRLQDCLAEAAIRVQGAKYCLKKKQAEVRELKKEAVHSLDIANFDCFTTDELTREVLRNQAAVSKQIKQEAITQKKTIEDLTKENKKLKEDLEAAQIDKGTLESAQLAVSNYEKETVPKLNDEIKDLKEKLAAAEKERDGILDVADAEVEEKISLAWNSYFDYGPSFFLKRYKWACRLYDYRQGICDPPISLRNLYLEEEGLPHESEEGQGDERFDKSKIVIPGTEEVQDDSPDAAADPPAS